MRRYAVDVPGGIDVEADLALDALMRGPPPEAPRTESENQSLQASFQNAALTPQRPTNDSIASGATEDANRDPEVAVLPISVEEPEVSPLRALLGIGPGGLKSASPSLGRIKMRDVRVFCNFLTQEKGKKQSFNVRLRDQGIRGRDVIEATIKAFLSSDDRLVSKFSDDPKEYSLFMADDMTGEEETRIQHDSPCGNFPCMALVPFPGAYLAQFPQRQSLLPPPHGDVSFAVEVKGTKVKHTAQFPTDMQVEKLERAIFSRLHIKDGRVGSLRIRYGPLLLAPGEKYNFGPGCGAIDVPISERTLLSLHRYGVTEVQIEGTVAEATIETPASPEDSRGLIGRMDEEEARAYQHFEVIKTNKYGVRQERVMGVDGDRIYNMRPSTEIGKTKNPERNIADIEVIRAFPDRPNYCEIEYKRSARFDTDKIEFRSTLDCSIFLEKLKVLKKLHERRTQSNQSDGALGRLLSKFGFGK